MTGHLVCRSQDELAVVVAQLPDHVARTRAEPGCLSFTVDQTDDHMVWQVDECFADTDAFTAHQEWVAASDWGQATAGIERRYVVSVANARLEHSTDEGDIPQSGESNG